MLSSEKSLHASSCEAGKSRVYPCHVVPWAGNLTLCFNLKQPCVCMCQVLLGCVASPPVQGCEGKAWLCPGAVQKPFVRWRGAADIWAWRLCLAPLGWKLLAIHTRWYLPNDWLYKMQKLTMLMGHQLILANKIHTLPTGTVGQCASLLMTA